MRKPRLSARRSGCGRLGRLVLALAIGGGFAFGADGAPATPGDILYVLRSDVPLRAEPRADAAVKGVMRRGQKVLEFAREAGWTRVGVFGAVGLEGWLPTAALGPNPEDADEASRGELHEAPGDSEAAPPPPAAPPRFDLTIEGTPGLGYSGDCRIVAGGGTVERSLRGLVPGRYRVDAQGLSCVVRKRDAFGRLIVTLYRDGRAIVGAETAAPFNHVRVRSDGPWGKARASRGAIAVPRFTPPEQPGPLVPPLRGPVVPPLRGSGGTTGGTSSVPPVR